MSSLLEKTLTYMLGGMVGTIIGYLILSFHVDSMFDTAAESAALVIITAVLGMLSSIAILEYKESKELKKNTLIRDETVALITHEMRTGLTSTGWAIDLVLKKYKDAMKPDDVQLLRDIVASIHTTVMHSVNLLDVSLLDIKKLTIALTWTRLDKVAETFKEVLEKYSIGAGQKGIELKHELWLDPAREAEVDMMRLRIVLENLLENAIQYAQDRTSQNAGPEAVEPAKQRLITVKIDNTPNMMNITVGDNGIGIPASEQAKIFSEFYRASNARRKLSAGSGIGLYTCSQYVKAHRGTIRFESTEGKGTTFYISIPLKTAADVEDFAKKI